MTHRRIHSAEFKRDAVQLARTGGNLSHTARELGEGASLLRKWLT
ncbi:transposase, partial [Deinococcus aerophilus]